MLCEFCNDTGWIGKCDCDPDGHYHCQGQGTCGTHECEKCPKQATLTLRRPGQDITVRLAQLGLWTVIEAVDEEGASVDLTGVESVDLGVRAENGEDETGR